MPGELATSPPPIRVLLADDDRTARTLAAHFVRAEPDLALIGTAEDAQEAILLAAERQPDVALLDVFMPRGGGVRATRHIRAVSPDTRILALSASDDREAVIEMLKAGCVGYLVKDETVDRLPEAIRNAAGGRPTITPAVTASVVDELVVRLDLEERRAATLAASRRHLQELLATDAIDLAFQPIVEMATGRVVGVEALARFPAEPRQPVEVWFAQATELGMAVELEVHVVRKALGALERLPDGISLSCNVSPVAASADELAVLLAESGRAGRVVVEVTEHAPVRDYEGLEANLTALRRAGARLAVDDVGAGFASLRHVLQLRPDFLKLDASLIRGIHADTARTVVAKGIVALGETVAATVVAEGVETRDESDALRAIGVEYAQGYLWSRPVSIDRLLGQLEPHSPVFLAAGGAVR